MRKTQVVPTGQPLRIGEVRSRESESEKEVRRERFLLTFNQVQAAAKKKATSPRRLVLGPKWRLKGGDSIGASHGFFLSSKLASLLPPGGTSMVRVEFWL